MKAKVIKNYYTPFPVLTKIEKIKLSKTMICARINTMNDLKNNKDIFGEPE